MERCARMKPLVAKKNRGSGLEAPGLCSSTPVLAALSLSTESIHAWPASPALRRLPGMGDSDDVRLNFGDHGGRGKPQLCPIGGRRSAAPTTVNGS